MDMRKWFKEAQYGMMVHWGLYSLLGGEWNGNKSSNYAEWIQTHQRIPNAEYEKLAKAFNPVYFNADEWVRFAKECVRLGPDFMDKYEEAGIHRQNEQI